MDGLSAKPRPPAAHLRAAKARHRGCVLFGYFLLHKQEKGTRPPGGRAEKHRDVSRSSRQRPTIKTKRWAEAHPMKTNLDRRNNESAQKKIGGGPKSTAHP